MNPIDQMKQAKAAKAKANTPTPTETAQNAAGNTESEQGKPTATAKAKTAQNANKGVLSVNPFVQVRYTFQTAKWSAANCKANFPNFFHHKQALRRECKKLCEQLDETHRLLAELTGKMNPKQQETAKRWTKTSKFLKREFSQLAAYIDDVEQADGEALAALCYPDEPRD